MELYIRGNFQAPLDSYYREEFTSKVGGLIIKKEVCPVDELRKKGKSCIRER